MTDRSRISLCAIVRDEASALPACLEAARGAAGELCVVDTGSTDDTVELARSFGARVRTVSWADSFADARNASLELATGDWILVLDADEVLHPGAAAELARVTADPAVEAAWLRFRHHVGDELREDAALRLFRRAPGLRYRGRVRESIEEAVAEAAEASGRRIVLCDARVDHAGFDPEVRRARRSDARDRRLFALALEHEPDDARTAYEHARFCQDDDPPAALAALEEACARIERLEPARRRRLAFCGDAYALRASELVRRGRVDEARACLETAHATCTATARLDHATGEQALAAGRWAVAREAFERCRARARSDGAIELPPPPAALVGELAEIGIARALFGEGRAREAADHLRAAHAEDPDSRDLVLWTARLLGDLAQHAAAFELCAHWLGEHPGDVGIWRTGGELLLEVGLISEARAWAERARTASEVPGTDAWCLLGQCHLASGDLRAAREAFERAPADPISAAGRGVLARLGRGALDLRRDADEPVDPATARLVRRLPGLRPRKHAG